MKKVLASIGLYAFPALLFAQQLAGVETFFRSVGRILTVLLPIVVALALLYFFWGLAKFVLAAGDESAKEEGKTRMIWGLVALFVMVSVWGLVSFIGTQLNIQQGTGPGNIPVVPIP